MLQPPSSNPTRDFLWGSSQVTVMATQRIFKDSFCNQTLVEFEVYCFIVLLEGPMMPKFQLPH